MTSPSDALPQACRWQYEKEQETQQRSPAFPARPHWPVSLATGARNAFTHLPRCQVPTVRSLSLSLSRSVALSLCLSLSLSLHPSLGVSYILIRRHYKATLGEQNSSRQTAGESTKGRMAFCFVRDVTLECELESECALCGQQGPPHLKRTI